MRFLLQFLCAFLTACSVMTPAQTVSVDVESPEALLQRLETFSCEEVSDFIRKRRPDPEKSAGVSQQHARRVLEVYLTLSRCALNERSRAEIFEGQLRGMVGALGDPHSSYYNQEEYAEMESDTLGQYSGVGLELDRDLAGLAARVVRAFAGSPAEKAGLAEGDLIFKIDDRVIIDFPSYVDFLKKLRGEKGTSVKLFVQKKTEQSPREVVLVRDNIKRIFVKAHILPSKWLHMPVELFEGTPVYDETRRMSISLCVDMRRLYNEVLSHEPQLQGVILDLRGNPGGLLSAAQCMASLFAPTHLASKTLLSERTREGIAPYPLVLNPQDMLRGKQLVVLVDECSASASEIVAKVVQYYRYGIIVGRQTYGKGSVQTVRPLYDGKTAVRYTSAEYLVGSVEAPAPVQGVGVMPDIPLKNADGAVSRCVARRERDLPGAIEGARDVKDIPPRDIQKENPDMYRRILEILAQKPFELVPEK